MERCTLSGLLRGAICQVAFESPGQKYLNRTRRYTFNNRGCCIRNEFLRKGGGTRNVLVVDDSLDPVDQPSHPKSEGTEKSPKEWASGVSFYSSISIVKDVASKRPLSSSIFSV